MKTSRTVWTLAGTVVAVAWPAAVAALTVVLVVPDAPPTFGFVVVGTTPLAVVVVGGAVVVVVSPRRLLACSLKLSRLWSPTLLSLPQAPDVTSARPASTKIMVLRL